MAYKPPDRRVWPRDPLFPLSGGLRLTVCVGRNPIALRCAGRRKAVQCSQSVGRRAPSPLTAVALDTMAAVPADAAVIAVAGI